MVPAFGVPLSFILHGVSLWQLKRGGARRDSAAGGFTDGREWPPDEIIPGGTLAREPLAPEPLARKAWPRND